MNQAVILSHRWLLGECIRIFQQVAALLDEDKIFPTTSSGSVEARVNQIELQLQRTSADRDIIALNLSSSVNQAIAMMNERDEAKLELTRAQQEGRALESQAKALELELRSNKESLLLAESARDAALKAQRSAEEAIVAVRDQARAR